MLVFGHLGDGNLHCNVLVPKNVRDTEFVMQQPAITCVVHDSVHRFGVSISAEHGLGIIKRYKKDTKIRLQSAIKRALVSPYIMTPGKLV
ncbi:FAD-binding oxidoreductase [Noviherbaspirillum pedocola]|uniref:FAD-binding oxidoreductase/transferase type 4 C-terminal domain-containing protein n=1 Tax=Noviherbaspirillum pedocola TaxID=2801341 RepID=A0A934T2P6_9BURK|nr:FAD-linked oxidase C-terminal domain-containing protein [Noviherbaspirillum pedocola]MBK4738527.1 hypothetical protein [Noviherbaspirillum pedocola]